MSTLKLVWGDGDPVHCDWHLQDDWDPTLASRLPSEVTIREHWTCKKDIRVVLQVLTGGPCLALLPSSQTSTRCRQALDDQHAQCLGGNKAAVASVTDILDLLLVAQSAMDGETAIPVFLGYVVARGAPELAVSLIESSRLPLLLDLDETLLSAYTSSNLDKKTKALVNDMTNLGPETDSNREEIAQLEREISFKMEDQLLLQQFMMNDSVTLDGQMYVAKTEDARTEAGVKPIMRPVIHLPNGVVLTRIDPNRKDTSMLFRTRPGWENLRKWLEGRDGNSRPGHQRFEVYVCTAAERSYALEAWRHLDPEALLIPRAQRQKRFVCVPAGRLKDVADVMGLPGHPWPSPVPPTHPPNSAMPLAVIIDDRADVWDELSRGQIFKVRPFHPHQHAATRHGVAMHDEEHVRALSEEMSAVKDALCNTRGWLYYTLDEILSPSLREAGPLRIEDVRAGRFAKHKWPRVCNLLQQAQQGTLPPVKAPDNSAAPRAAAAAAQPADATASSLAPVDPRRGCHPGDRAAAAGALGRTASSTTAPTAAAGRQRAAVPDKGKGPAARSGAAAAEPDLARRASNATAGPSGAKPVGRSRAAVDPRLMAAAPVGMSSKPSGKARGGPALGRGRAQPAAVQGRATIHHGAKPVARPPDENSAPTVAAAAAAAAAPSEQAGAAQAGSSAQPGRKRGLEGEQEASQDNAKRPAAAAANGKPRRSGLSSDMEKAWLHFAGKAKPSSGAPAPADAAGEDAAANTAQGSTAAGEPQIFSAQASVEADGAADGHGEEAPSKAPVRTPSESSLQHSSQLSPGGRRKAGMGGSFLPVRSPTKSRGASEWPAGPSSVSSPPQRRAEELPRSPVQSNAQAATPNSKLVPPSEGDTSPLPASVKKTAELAIPPGCQHASLDELPAELRQVAHDTGARVQFQHWKTSGMHCARILMGGMVLGWGANQGLVSAKSMAIKEACERLGVFIAKGTKHLKKEAPVSSRTAIHRVEHLYPSRLEWGTAPREDSKQAVGLSLDKGEISAEAWAPTQTQAKRRVALRLLLELGCPLEDDEDQAGVMASSWVKLRVPGAGKPTMGRSVKYTAGRS